MVSKLCLMASHGYPSGVVLQPEQGVGRVIQDYQPLLPCHGSRHGIMRLGSLKSRPQECEEPWKPMSGFSESNHHVKIDSAVKKPILPDIQDASPGSLLFSFEIAEKCTRHEKILQFLTSQASEPEKSGMKMSLLSKLMELEALKIDAHQHPTPLIYPNTELFLDFVGDLVDSSRITVYPDGQVLFNGTGTEMKDLLSVVAEFYLAKNSSKWKKQSMLVPHYTRLDNSEGVIINGSSLTLQATTVAPLKSPQKTKVKSLPKKKNGKKLGRERDLYKKNYFRACENLLSLMVSKRKYGKTAILSLKKSGPELPELLTQFSAGIAGTGLAVLFSVICKVACGRVPLTASKFFNTGIGCGLVWLSWAVNKLRDSIVYISKNAGKLGLKEEDMVKAVDSSIKEIYFRAATVMAVAMLRLV
ncbi:uncharacterized protein LOC107425994 [Ziziphus jujuba]|uniref:Uncharacterized protein LOC107425994 n=1 Tax=Ziziphus jujuba TaxID=326968 RepID=A0A6P4A786_ZIZJJ|nr:uncharacterized protein LOC107425994 [Ziziphus jujuba]